MQTTYLKYFPYLCNMNGIKTAIKVNKLRLYGYHGVLSQETKVGNVFEISVTLNADATDALMEDCLDGTVNYAEVVEIIKHEMKTPSKLLENVAYRFQQALIKRFPQITGGEISVAKLAPPISAQLESVEITLKW